MRNTKKNSTGASKTIFYEVIALEKNLRYFMLR